MDQEIVIDLLGPLEVRRAGRPVALPRRRRSLLALLALRAGEPVTVEQLVDGLWGEDAPLTAVRTLHAHIAKLGAALAGDGGPRVIERRDPGYLLAAAAVRTDRDRFEEQVAAGLRFTEDGRFADAARSYRAGLALWRGGVLSDTPVYGWAVAETEYLGTLRLQAHEGAFAAGLASGTGDPGVAELERLVAGHPFRERLWELLIVALQVSGRTADALAIYQRARRTLAGELGIEPGQGLRHVETAVLRGVTDARELLRMTPPGPLTLPQPVNALIGRDTDITETTQLLREYRLVTLTGFGGSGKTRLAAAAARAAAADFSEVAFVDLAALRDGELVPAAVADTLGVPEQAELARRIARDRLLLILDNCEHLIADCAQLAHDLLTRCPHLRILATSQEALRLPGEAVRPVRPLRTPHPEAVGTAADLAGYPAVTLFAERARLGPAAALSPADAVAVATICARCEGLPLALELAAARARLLTLPEIARNLQDRFEVLSGGPRGVPLRHRALRATVDWSYRLLTPAEQSAVRRVAVFGNPFTREAAAAVFPGMPILDVLSRLVDKSLLTVLTTPHGTRYQLLETIREYALEQLAAHPDEHRQAHYDHADHFLRNAEELERQLQGPELGPAMQRLIEHHDDLRAALDRLVADDPSTALRFASALWRYHYLRGHYREGRDWLRSARSAASPAAAPRVRAKASWAAARLAALDCDYQEAIGLAEDALELYEDCGDDPGIAQSQAVLGAVARELGDYRQAIWLGRRSVAAAERTGDRWATGHATQLLGFASWLSCDFTAAAELSARALELLGPVGDRERLAWCQLDLGAVALYTGDLEGAARHLRQALLMSFEVRFKEGIAWAENLLALADLDQGRPQSAVRRLTTSLRLHTELGDRWRQASVLEGLARAASLLGDDRLAAGLLGTAEEVRAEIGAPVPACERPALAAVRAQIGDAAGSAAGPDRLERLQTQITALSAPHQ